MSKSSTRNPPIEYLYKISLFHKYDSGLFNGDYSRGTFFEGHNIAQTQEEANDVIQNFLTTGTIELYEATKKYVGSDVSNEKTIVQFMNNDINLNFYKRKFKRSAHSFGDGFIWHDTGNRKYFYWLDIEKVYSPSSYLHLEQQFIKESRAYALVNLYSMTDFKSNTPTYNRFKALQIFDCNRHYNVFNPSHKFKDCPITGERYNKGFVTECGHHFSYNLLFADTDKCPTCNEKM